MRSHEPRGRHDLDEADVVVLAPWRGFPSAAGEPAYVSWMRIERLGGPQRLAYLPAEDEPMAFGVHSRWRTATGSALTSTPARDHSRLRRSRRRRLTGGTFAGALEARQIDVDRERYEAEAIGEVCSRRRCS